MNLKNLKIEQKKLGWNKFLKYQLYHRLTYLYIDLFKKDSITYSANKEDQIIDILTEHKEKGIYIDIGAFHPDKISNTKKFYERGWKGINIEPSQGGYKLFKERRPQDINLNIAIGEGKIDYEEYGYPKKEIRKIILTPLRQIFKDYKLDFVDFISIDVEDLEESILESNDWNRYKVGVICIEGKRFDNFLKQFGYEKAFYDGGNTYYKLNV